ncbi:MAG TPA: ester cyclase [Acidimicrobiales bacterium]|nr:ester cyclase [Acidimicrobiales bacterium]
MAAAGDVGSTAAANEAVVRRFYEEVFNQRREDVIREVISSDYVDYGHDPPGRGPEGAIDDFRGVLAVSDDARYDIEDLVAAGDTVAVRWTGHLTHTGPIAGIEPTGKKLTLPGMSFYKLRNGQIVETRNLVDMLGFLSQVGAIPGG